MKRSKSLETLSSKIRKQFGIRILICLILYLVIFFAVTYFDFSRGISRISQEINEVASRVNAYVVSQILIGNEQSIKYKLAAVSKDNNMKINWSHDRLIEPDVMHFQFPLNWSYSTAVTTLDGRNYGFLEFRGTFFNNKDFIFEMGMRVLFLLLSLVLMIIILYPLSVRIPKVLFIEPLMNILSLLKKSDHKKNSHQDKMPAIELREIEIKIIELLEQAKKDSKNVAMGQIAAQVAHDIRSPLAALNVMLSEAVHLRSDQKELLRNAVSRINSIANNLLSHHSDETHLSDNLHDRKTNPVLIYPLIDSIVMEKQVVFKDKVQIRNDASPSFIFAKVDPVYLKRILSNIINNALEAIQKNGVISINMETSYRDITLSIKDNGCGIPNTILPKVFDYGFTHGKDNGSGIGLATSKERIESWGGKIGIQSKLGSGTEVIITLPKQDSPAWFASEISIMANSTIVLVDDDPCIHSAWNRHLENVKNASDVINILNFYNPIEFQQWFNNKKDSEHYCYLIDYEFSGFSETGIDIIKKCNIGNNSYLFTSRADEDDVIEKCEEDGFWLIPKQVLHLITFQVCPEKPDLIFIDDDRNLGEAWKYKAEFSGKQIVYFSKVKMFKSLMKFFNKFTPVYIDSDLGEDQPGEEIAKSFYEYGLDSIYLATGRKMEGNEKPYWIKAIVNKEPPY